MTLTGSSPPFLFMIIIHQADLVSVKRQAVEDMENQVYLQKRRKMSGEVWNLSQTQAWDNVYFQVADQIRDQIWDEITTMGINYEG